MPITEQTLLARQATLQARLARYAPTAGGMPGTAVTGRSKVPAARLRLLDRQVGTTVARAVVYRNAHDDLLWVNAQLAAIANSDDIAARQAFDANRQQLAFALIEVGDRIDVGGNTPLVVTRKNRVTVATGPGCLWRANEIVRVHKTPRDIPTDTPNG